MPKGYGLSEATKEGIWELRAEGLSDRKIGRRLGMRRPLPPKGVEIFWRRIYVPLFHRLPPRLRDSVIARMPGSHQKEWKRQPPSRGPAV